MTSTRDLLIRLIAIAALAIAPGASGASVKGWRADAEAALARGDFDAAAQVYDRALADGHGTAELWAEIGRLRYRTGQHELALQAAIRAVELGPRDPAALEFRGQLVRDARGPLAALPWFERALAQLPDDLALLGEYAATLAEAGRQKDMLRVARRMVEIDPRHPRAYFLQAVLAARAGHDDLARRLLTRTRGVYEDAPAGRLLAGVLELRTGNPGLAAAEFDALVRRQPDNALAMMLAGRALLAAGQIRDVIARLGPAADRGDASPYVLTLVGRAFEHLGDREAAARYLDRAGAEPVPALAVLAFGRDDDPLRVRDGEEPGADAVVPALRRLVAQGRSGEAMALAERASRRFAGSADVETLAGDVALLAGDPAAALRSYTRVAQVRRDFALVERMVRAMRMLGREQEASRLLADHVTLNPRGGAASALLGRMAARRGDWTSSALLLEHARGLSGGRDARLLSDLASAHWALGEQQSAEDLARQAYSLQRMNGRVATVLARIVATQEGGRAEAAALLAKAPQDLTDPQLARR